MADDDPFNLDRFVVAQDMGGSYLRAIDEVRDGHKVSHWIWWVFPQLAGLGASATSREYAVSSLAEAQAYVRHPVLGPRLREATAAMISHVGVPVHTILANDDVKFRSSMTLFHRAEPREPLFSSALERFFDSAPDPKTEQLLVAAR